tara:strand:+ start:229 stop:507 length:279 start_codon:yes stop_codon:yes gene_type:complete
VLLDLVVGDIGLLVVEVVVFIRTLPLIQVMVVDPVVHMQGQLPVLHHQVLLQQVQQKIQDLVGVVVSKLGEIGIVVETVVLVLSLSHIPLDK